MDKKLMVKLALAVVAAVLFNWNYIFGKKKAAATAATTAATAANSKGGAATAVSGGGNTGDKKGEDGKKSEELLPDTPGDYPRMLLLAQGNDWGTDPFGIPPKAVAADSSQPKAAPVADKEEEKDKEELKLESIMITPVQSLAVINGHILAEGDVFQGKQITRITRDTVVMKSNGNSRELRLKDSDIPMVYEKDAENERK